LLERRNAIAWLTLNRPEALNTINTAMRAVLGDALREADADAEVRVIVLRGAGTRAFCAGADIKEFANVMTPAAKRQALLVRSWSEALAQVRKPLIASIHGFCLGGGLEIAMACDIRIVAPDATLGFPEVSLGILTGAGGSQNLLRTVGLGKAMDLMLTAERIDGKEAHRLGIVTRVAASAESLAAETEALAEKIAGMAPLAAMFAKEVLKKGQDVDLSSARALEADLVSMLLATDDCKEAVLAFREKRKPVFTGT
jgi:enoyl-CoA hydratase/carnithine racemase